MVIRRLNLYSRGESAVSGGRAPLYYRSAGSLEAKMRLERALLERYRG